MSAAPYSLAVREVPEPSVVPGIFSDHSGTNKSKGPKTIQAMALIAITVLNFITVLYFEC